MEYRVIQSNSLKTFEENVNNAIKDGWTPQGGVFISTYIDDGNSQITDSIYSQAVIKN